MSRGPDQLRLTPDERADLVAYVDGELPEASARAIATKLTQSATARREVEMLQKTWELLGHLPMPQADAQFSERTITHIRQLHLAAPGWDPRVKFWAVQAAHAILYLILGLVGVGAGYVGTRWLWPDPAAHLVRDLSLAEHLNEYLEVGSFEFLSQLADSPEFGLANH
jgi:anti-sigma factor RsiW